MTERLTDEQLRARVAELEDLLRQAAESIERSLVEKRALRARVARLEAALRGLEPYLDAIVCYASTMDEHEPNRLAHIARAALKAGL